MTPAQTGEMLLAKTSPVFVLMMVVLFAALGVGMLAFGLPLRGSLWLFTVAGAFAALAGLESRCAAGSLLWPTIGHLGVQWPNHGFASIS